MAFEFFDAACRGSAPLQLSFDDALNPNPLKPLKPLKSLKPLKPLKPLNPLNP